MEKRKINKFRVIAALELLIILALIISLIISCCSDKKTKSVPVSTDTPVQKEEGFYQFDGKKILLSDGVYGEIYLPVYQNVPACSHDLNSLITRNGYTFYRENNQITSKFGIDVSQYQGDIDWAQVKAAGVDFAMVRVGVRTYGGGEISLDENFAQNIENATENGIDVGVYFFSQAVSVDEAEDEADALLKVIKDYDITYPVVYDWEIIYDDKARTDTVTVETLADCCIAFCERVKSKGYTPMIYQSQRAALLKLDLPRLQNYDFWLAEYNSLPNYYYDFDMWQYSQTGSIPGIEGNVDLNISFKDYSK